MTLCMELARMCEQSDGPLAVLQGDQVALSIDRSRDGEDWQVTDWRASGQRYIARNSHSAAIKVHDLLGFEARRVLIPLIAAWRYRQLFPIGSSLERVPEPLASWRPSAQLARIDWG